MQSLHVDGSPLIGPTNLSWVDLCEELLGVRPEESELQGSIVKLSWLAHHFPNLNNHGGNLEQVERGVLFVDKSSNKVSVRYLQFLRDFRECSTYSWGSAVLGYLYTEMCSATNYTTKSIGGMCILIQMWVWERCTTLTPRKTPPVIENKPLGHRWLRRGNQHIGNDDLILFRRKLYIMKRHEFVWEPYSSNVMSVFPPICLVGSVAWCAVVPLICFQVIEWHKPDRVLRQFGMQQPIPSSHSQPFNIHGISLRGKHEKNWGQLLGPMINQWNNRTDFRVDAYPRQEGLLSFNSDYMVWYRRKTKMFVDPKNANMATLAEVTEMLQYMVSPQGRNTWMIDDLVPYVEKITILSEDVETKGIVRRRETVEVESYVHSQMAERGHGMYYTPSTFSQYSAQIYQYPFEVHQSDMSASEHSLGGVAETYVNFPWPTMTPSEQHDVPIETPNAPLGTQWNVPEAIPNVHELLGVDLRHQFSLEADQHEEGGHRGRRNPTKMGSSMRHILTTSSTSR
ncbi:Serine/threonine-protein phosphatase 7 long form [Glycine soja]